MSSLKFAAPFSTVETNWLPIRIADYVAIVLTHRAILYSILVIFQSIRPVYRKWPIRRGLKGRLSKHDIIKTLPRHEGALPADDVCGICRDTHKDPLRLPCNHIYCTDCIDPLFDFSQNHCGLCHHKWFSLDSVAPSPESQRAGMAARQRLLKQLGHLVMIGLCLITFMVCRPCLKDDQEAYPYLLILGPLGAYCLQTFIVRDFTWYMDVYGEEWWPKLPELDPREDLSPLQLSIMAVYSLFVLILGNELPRWT